ncbi:MAG: alpha/beta hydrolase [Amycolatopsis sp.]|uniref:alpha/beta fold hydrolase n=1 Tax=Amycolatopsis sp. TaxID=37632 RepID=UPI0026058E56|nr:alpha/beta hydrolase [Amycolatopsis sp.]MCU1681212.1 alpha/beta hydrolase [Amycolatopsis sp.]
MPNLTVNGTELYYEDEGAGRPVVFLHGWGTSGRVWNAQLPEFVREHRVITLDWRGCGRSGRPAAGNTIAGVVADVVSVLDQLALDAPIVVGSSIGAVFGTDLALRHPGRIGGLVVVDGPGYWPATAIVDEVLALPGKLAADRAGTVVDWVSGWYAPGVSPALVDWTVRQVLDAGVYIDELLTESTTHDPRPLLPGLTVPIAYLHGELDPAIPLDVPRTCAALTAAAEFLVIEGAGHMPHQERPAEFNASLRLALKSVAP